MFGFCKSSLKGTDGSAASGYVAAASFLVNEQEVAEDKEQKVAPSSRRCSCLWKIVFIFLT